MFLDSPYLGWYALGIRALGVRSSPTTGADPIAYTITLPGPPDHHNRLIDHERNHSMQEIRLMDNLEFIEILLRYRGVNN